MIPVNPLDPGSRQAMADDPNFSCTISTWVWDDEHCIECHYDRRWTWDEIRRAAVTAFGLSMSDTYEIQCLTADGYSVLSRDTPQPLFEAKDPTRLWLKSLGRPNNKSLASIPVVNIDKYDLVLSPCLGSGTYGVVFRGREKSTGKEVAVKKASKTPNLLYDRELDLAGSIRHETILAILGRTEFQGDEQQGSFDLILPLMKNGSLEDHLTTMKDPTMKLKILSGIAVGLFLMHELRYPHRDLKPANILLDENFEPKIADFGLTKFAPGANIWSSRDSGTPLYQAPEYDPDANYDCFPADVYAFGLIIYAVVTGTSSGGLFPGVTRADKLKKLVASGRRPEFPKTMSGPLVDLAKICWDQDPLNRPTAQEIVARMASPAFLSKTDGVNLTEFREYHQRAGISSLIRDSTRIQALQTELSETKIQLETERKRSASTATRLSAVEAECQRTRDEATALSDELSETKRQLEAERNRTARERSQAELLSQQLAIMRADLERAKAQITSLCADVSAGQLECKKAKLDAQSRFEELALANAKADQCASELLSTKKRLEIEAQEKAALSVELEHTVDQLATEKNEAATVAGRCSLLQAGFCEIAALLERPFETAQMLSSG